MTAVTVPAVPPEPLKTTVFDASVVWKFVPVRTIDAPARAFVGVKLETVVGLTVKLPPVTLPYASLT